MVRVLMVSHACTVAAYRRKLEELARIGGPELELTLVVPPRWGSARFEPGNERGYAMRTVSPVLNGRHHLHWYPALRRIMAELKPDLLHLDEEPYDLVTFHGLLTAQRTGARTVFFTWQNLFRRFPPPFGLWERYVLQHAHGAIAGTEGAASVLRRKGYGGPLFCIPQFGVDPEVYSPEPRADKETARPFRIGFAGRLVPEKGAMLLLEAAAGLAGPWELWIVGAGPEARRLEARSSALGVGERLRLLPWRASEEMPAFYRSLDVLVLPSRSTARWAEQFGRVLVEAMACGVPVIGSRSGEIPWVIGDAGLLFPEDDVQELRQCLQRLQEDARLRQELAEKGRTRVLERFTQEKVARDTWEAYQQVLGP